MMMVGIPTQEVKPFKMANKLLIGSTARIAYNVMWLDAGGKSTPKL